eukprot:TRINITY_DN27343_c0_g1_i1.p1 TRINITY_DN27343_c0_g1~~TRINITY_DN27343_c0_g1_i1.p1  ORF type:complete len:488 (+),score=65.87 TRINITY_DN27343_c0_g1_i1:90-1553(+)
MCGKRCCGACFLILLALIGVLWYAATPPSTTAGYQTLHLMDLDAYPMAMCLDGSPGGFYFWPATSAAARNKFVIYHHGGGWCSTEVPTDRGEYGEFDSTVDSCFSRTSNNFGSTVGWARDADVGWTPFGNEETLLSTDPHKNPMMHDWNKVAIIYCDGGSFSGRNRTVQKTDGKNIYFRGSWILEAVQDTLLKKFNLGDASEVVIGGASAGGLSVYLHVDQWRAIIPSHIFVVGYADDGFFLDWNYSKGPLSDFTYDHVMRYNFQAFNVSSAVNQACVKSVAAAGGQKSDCYFAEHTVPFITTPIFAFQSTLDTFQLLNFAGITFPPMQRSRMAFFHSQMVSRFEKYFLSKPGRAGFVDNCPHHTSHWETLTSKDGTTAANAFVEWYKAEHASFKTKSKNPGVMSWWQDFPCDDCCNGDLGPLNMKGWVSGLLSRRRTHGSQNWIGNVLPMGVMAGLLAGLAELLLFVSKRVQANSRLTAPLLVSEN